MSDHIICLEATAGLIHTALVRSLFNTFTNMGIIVTEYEINALISPVKVRNILIIHEYREMLVEPGQSESAFYTLADKYGMNPETIKSIVYRKR